MERMDYNSRKNQSIKGKFVEREVLTCFSYEMHEILSISCERSTHVPTYEDIENLYVGTCPECGNIDASIETDVDVVCPYCKENVVYEQQPQEILEWWIVSDFLYKKLKAHGEPVLDWGNNYYWGRTCSGQAIMLDDVISKICEEMQILEGQERDWSKLT